jgi:hypothetical protein
MANDQSPIATTVVATFLNEPLAELARATLEAHDIPAFVRTSDAAGLLRVVEGVQLVIRREDFVRARRILERAREDDAS